LNESSAVVKITPSK